MQFRCKIENLLQPYPTFQIDPDDAIYSLKSKIRSYLRNHPITPFDVEEKLQDIKLNSITQIENDNQLLNIQDDSLITVKVVNFYKRRHREIELESHNGGVWNQHVFWTFDENPQEQITLGHYITNRTKQRLDELPINLSAFSANINNPRNVHIVAGLWKYMTDEMYHQNHCWITERNPNGTSKYSFIRDPQCISSIKTRVNENDTSRNIIVGDTQIGKSLDIATLSWFMQKLGYLPFILVRNNGGSNSINTLKEGLQNIKETGIRMIRESNLTLTLDDQRFLDLQILGRKLTRNPQDYKLGDLQKGGFVIADLQNYSFCKRITNIVYKCQSIEKEYPICCIADEDDDTVSSFDGSKTKIEIVSIQKTNGDNLDHQDVPLSDFFKNTTFKKACRVMISITATAFPLIHNKQDLNSPIYVVQKDNSKYPNYHGWTSPEPFQIQKKVVVEPSLDNSSSLLTRHQIILDEIFHDANIHYNSFSHVNMLLTSHLWTRIDKMETFQYDIIKEYGSHLPAIGFSFNSNKEMYITFNVRSQLRVGGIFDKLGSITTNLRNKWPNVFENITNSSENQLYSWRLNMKKKQRSLGFYYDIIVFISECLNIPKLFAVCIGGHLADRAFTFKDSNHKFYVTHMYTNFKINWNKKINSTSYGKIIQKIGRICGKDDHGQVPRFMYMNQDCINVSNEALEQNQKFIKFFAKHPGKTVKRVLKLASESEFDIFKNLLCDPEEGGSMPWHTKSYSEKSILDIPKRLKPSYKQTIAALEPTTPPPDYVDINNNGGDLDTSKPCIEFQRAFEHDLGQISDITREHNLHYALNTYQCTVGRTEDTWKSLVKHLINENGTIKRLHEWTFIDETKLDISLASFKQIAVYQPGHSWRNGHARGSIIKVRDNYFKLSWR